MHECEKLESRFDALADDKFSVDRYIEQFLLKEYIQMIQDVAEENGDTVSKENWQEFLDSTPSTFSEKIRNLYETI